MAQESDLELAKDALKAIAEMHTNTRLDEALCFLKVRRLAMEICKELNVDFQDQTFGGKTDY